MKNSFVYGEAVSGEFFCNRKDETLKLVRGMANCQKIFLAGSRRLGKTSLLKTVKETLEKKGVKVIFLDIEGVTTYKRFLELYLTQISSEFTVSGKFFSFIKKLLPGIGLSMNVENEQVGLELKYHNYDPDLEQTARKIFDLPTKLAKRKGCVVIFDEFQEIEKLNGGTICANLRAVIQHHRNVGYIFSGSKRDLLVNMVNQKSSPFYKIGPLMILERILGAELEQFIEDRFNKSRQKISKDAIKTILEVSENIPYYTQMIAFETWEEAYRLKKMMTETDIRNVVDELVRKNDPQFREKWSSLTMVKRQVLNAMVHTKGESLMSKGILDRYGLKAVSSISTALTFLKNEYIIDKEGKRYYVDDILFREWIKQNAI